MSCKGLYADVTSVSTDQEHVANKLTVLQDEYNSYKRLYAKNLVFDPSKDNYTFENTFQPFQVVRISLTTATFDIIEKDIRVTIEDLLGSIGGTMGLCSGFSILSGVELLYFVTKYFMLLVKITFEWFFLKSKINKTILIVLIF